MRTVAPLAPFSEDWVGGDIRGLQGIARELYGYVPRVGELTGTLSVTVRDLTGDDPGSWQGSAATAFARAWDRQARTAAAVAGYVTAVAAVIDGLAVELARLENALEQEARGASRSGVQIAPDGSVAACEGPQSLRTALAYQDFRARTLSDAAAARQAATRELTSLYQQALNPDPHPDGADAVTGTGLLADMLAAPTSGRREILEKIKRLKGENLSLDEKIAKAREEGKPLQKLQEKLDETDTELQQVQDELDHAGKLESALSKLLDTRIHDVRGYLAGAAGEGKHVAGNTPEDLRSAAGDEPGALERLLGFADDIPVIDIGATAAGTAVGTYYDVKDGQPLGSALRDEIISNTAGTAAANAAAGLAGVEFGSELGAAAGPVGIAVGAVVGYGVGDLTHNLLIEPWGADMHEYGAVLGVVYGVGHSGAATVDDARELAVGIGHDAEHYWDDVF
jgi:uncharacterized protein YukE